MTPQLAYLRIKVLGKCKDPLGRDATEFVVVNRLGVEVDGLVHYLSDESVLIKPQDMPNGQASR